jgi:hypothetical protein
MTCILRRVKSKKYFHRRNDSNKYPCLEYLNLVLTIFYFVAFNNISRLDTAGTNQPTNVNTNKVITNYTEQYFQRN